MDRVCISFKSEGNIQESVNSVIEDIDNGACGRTPQLIIYAADSDAFCEVTALLSQKFPNSVVMGISSYVNFTSKGYALSGVSALAIYDGIECESGLLKEIQTYPMRYIDSINDAVSKFDDLNNICCLEFTTAFGNCEEIVQDTFRTALEKNNIPVFGGSAGARDNVKTTFVALNGNVYDCACVFVLIKNTVGKIHIFKENMFRPSGHTYVATDVDCDERAVYEYDNKPAAVAVANSLQMPVEKLKDSIMLYPVGRVIGNEIYITEVDSVFPDGRITYYSRIYNNTIIRQLEVDDIDAVWNNTTKRVKAVMDNISFCFVINCLSRSKYFLANDRFAAFNEHLTESYGQFIGISGYGEQMNYEQLNQTMLLLAFE